MSQSRIFVLCYDDWHICGNNSTNYTNMVICICTHYGFIDKHFADNSTFCAIIGTEYGTIRTWYANFWHIYTVPIVQMLAHIMPKVPILAQVMQYWHRLINNCTYVNMNTNHANSARLAMFVPIFVHILLQLGHIMPILAHNMQKLHVLCQYDYILYQMCQYWHLLCNRCT